MIDGDQKSKYNRHKGKHLKVLLIRKLLDILDISSVYGLSILSGMQTLYHMIEAASKG